MYGRLPWQFAGVMPVNYKKTHDCNIFQATRYGLPIARSFFWVSLIFIFFLAGVAHAALFSWKDDKGQLHVTDNYSNVPPEYRKQSGRIKTFESKPAPAFPEKAKSSRQSEFEIPLLPGGENHFLVEVVINGRGKARLLLDTGASMITLNRSVARRLGLDVLSAPKIPFSTAGGKVEMPLVALDLVDVSGASARLVETAINPMDMGGIDGLLGMSFLSNFKFEIDQIHSRLVLRPLSDKGEFLYGDRPGDWWKLRFDYVTQRIQQSSANAHALSSQGNQEARNAKKLAAYYKRLYRKLEQRAFRVGVPSQFK